jgi:cytochrome oxidase Cu insertion factor (SCO1/SenC/PrrC family)
MPAPSSSPTAPPTPAHPAAQASEPAGLTRRELLGTLAVALGLAAAVAGIAFLAARHDRAGASAHKPDKARRLAPFALTDRTGRTVTLADVRGKILVANFVFSGCSLSCRAVNNRMEEIQRLVGEAPDVRLFSVTVDPRSDTPAVLARFADSFHADTNRWLFLTGEKDAVYELLEQSFLPRSRELEGQIPGGFVGTDRIMLVDADGNVCASFDGLRPGAPEAVAAEIQNLRKAARR